MKSGFTVALMNSRFTVARSIVAVVVALAVAVLLLPRPESATAPEHGSRAGAATDQDAPTVIVDVRLFDGESVIESVDVFFSGGRVVEVGRDLAIPAGASVVDGQGKTVLPGLIDAHVHSFGAARSDALRFGVTTVLDMFRTPFDFDQTHVEREALGPAVKADLFSAGFLATVAGGHGTQYGIEVPVLSGPEQAEAWVAARQAEGSDWIKIVIEPGWGELRLPTLDPVTVRALVDAAHDQNLLAVAHVTTYADAMMTIEAGIDGLVHMFADRAVDTPFLKAARAAGIFVVPTTPVLAGMHGHDDTAWLDAHPRLGPRLTSAQRQSLAQRFPIPAQDTSTWPLVETSIQALHEAGIAILAGSDAPNPGTAHGASIHHALRLLVSAGLSPAGALRAATSAPAEEFGLQDRGCLKPGCRADLVLVEGNPLVDIAATAQIDSVWKNGRRVGIELSTARATPAVADEAAGDPVDLLGDAARWTAAADDFMGGASESAITWTDDGEAAALNVATRIASGYAFPYAGAMWFADAVPMKPRDHTGYRRLVLKVDGSAGEYQALLFSGEAQSTPPIRIAIEPGRATTMELDAIAGLDLETLRAIGVFAGGEPREVEFTIRRARLE